MQTMNHATLAARRAAHLNRNGVLLPIVCDESGTTLQDASANSRTFPLDPEDFTFTDVTLPYIGPQRVVLAHFI